MAPSAVNGEEKATIGAEEINKPPSGVVLPPKDIRAIVEKTAGYVARNGPVFEDRIRDKEKNNPKFSFLSLNDAYSAFYAWRLTEIKAGRGTAIAAGRPGEVSLPAGEAQKSQGPVEPPEFHFSARMPNINAQDLDVVRLTALFVARNGRQFMTALSQRESRNFQFDFLRPNHSLYQFFTRLVDQYTELLKSSAVDGEGSKAEQERIQELRKNVDDRFHVLDRARQRAEWAKIQEQQKQKKEEEEEKEKLTYAQIDWHDFVVVETVLFNEADEQADLPAPTSLSDLQSASLEQKAMMSLAPHNMRIEEAMPGEEDSYHHSYAPPLPAHDLPLVASGEDTTSAMVIDTIPPAEATNTEYDNADDDNDDEAQRIRERTEARARARQAQAEAKGGAGPMKIRSDYVPRAAAQAANRRGVQMALCPNCKQQIPYNELDEHMRIELLDPRWKEEKAKADSRMATTNLSTQDVANNLKRLASQRSDVFDASISNPHQPQQGGVAHAAMVAAPGGVNASHPNPIISTSNLDDDDASRRKRLALSGPGLGPTSVGVRVGVINAANHGNSAGTFYDGLTQSDPRDSYLRLQQQQHHHHHHQQQQPPPPQSALQPMQVHMQILQQQQQQQPQPQQPVRTANVEEQIKAIHEKWGKGNTNTSNGGNSSAITSATTVTTATTITTATATATATTATTTATATATVTTGGAPATTGGGSGSTGIGHGGGDGGDASSGSGAGGTTE